MSIPNTSDEFRAPPPLPPPRFVPVNGPMSHAAEEYHRRELDTVEELPNYKTRPDRDEGYHSMESRSRDSRDSFSSSSKFSLPYDKFMFRSRAYAYEPYDNSLLKKLDSRRSVDNRSPPRDGISSSMREATRPTERFPGLQPLSLPTRMKQGQLGQPNSMLLESPSRFTETPLHSAVSLSPRSTPFSHYGNDHRSPRDQGTGSDYDRSPGARTRRTNSGSVTDDGYNETALDDDSFTMEETRLRDFHIDTPASRASADYHAGQKRRASSPPGGDEPPPLLYHMPSNEHMRWRDGASRGSPAPRLSTTHESLPSISPSTRTGSYGSNLSPAATSVTSLGLPFSASQGGRSPGGVSPISNFSPTETTANSAHSTSGGTSPYIPSIPLTISPRSTVTRAPQQRSRDPTSSVASPTRRQPELAKAPPGAIKRSEFFMCDCCPKKPKKFDTDAQLRAHEMEKQYECNYCGNRFKNKNEAERHQNSLHVRRHSWSCAALSSYDRAYHDSSIRPDEVDVCGYCGEEFERSGLTAHKKVRVATEQDWDERIRHLQDVHKFRECNASKKFFRADHFRQHLKHSHAGTSGKWTNMLENACMMEEEPPLPIR